MICYIGAVELNFKLCCGDTQTKMPLLEFFNSGLPICPECGKNLNPEDTVELNEGTRNNSLSDEKILTLAEEIVDGMAFDDGQEILISTEVLLLNAQTDEELAADEPS